MQFHSSRSRMAGDQDIPSTKLVALPKGQVAGNVSCIHLKLAKELKLFTHSMFRKLPGLPPTTSCAYPMIPVLDGHAVGGSSMFHAPEPLLKPVFVDSIPFTNTSCPHLDQLAEMLLLPSVGSTGEGVAIVAM